MNSFISLEEEYLTAKFMCDGYVIFPAESRADLDALKSIAMSVLGAASLDDCRLAPDELNAMKLRLMGAMNAAKWTRRSYFRLAKNSLYTLIGNELAMQKKFNVNIQLPGDAKSLLPVHADTWTGDSPYQLVCWVPLVDCYRTKSMYILPPGEPFSMQGGAEDVWNGISSRVKFLEIRYGEVLLFNPTLPHGNRVNEEDTARWSINCRFKSVWSPYAVKGPGEHFEPITLRAASRIGMDYQHPEVV